MGVYLDWLRHHKYGIDRGCCDSPDVEYMA